MLTISVTCIQLNLDLKKISFHFDWLPLSTLNRDNLYLSEL